jgi:predicted phosphodiesterase
VPSGDDAEVDSFLCSPEFLQELVRPSPDFPGLVLQLAEPPSRQLFLNHIFPAFHVALFESSDWPGILVWNRRGQSAFFPFASNDRQVIRERALWLLNKLYDSPFPDFPELSDIRQLYKVAFPDTRPERTKLHILQISDIHLGCEEAGIRLSRTQQHIENLVGELVDGTVVPVVTGDLMDSPNDRNLDAVRLFFQFLKNLGTAPPLAVLGNHDVRKDGWLRRALGRALQVPVTHGVHWYDDAKVGIACFNSVIEGRLARGFIGERQRIDIANQIDGDSNRREFAVVGVLHHHPIPVEPPDWLAKPFYERFLGDSFEKTKVLEDAEAFVQYAEAMQMAAVLHGHEHIPRIAETPNGHIPVFGCGSSVGKIKTKVANETCLSLNVITLDPARRHLTGKVLAERVVGAGLSLYDRHAMVYRRRVDWVHKATAG